MPDYNLEEAKEARRDGAKLHKNSGRGQFSAGDATLAPFMVDYKFAEKSFTLNEAVWAKVCTDASKHRDLSPALKVIIGESSKTRLWIVEDHIIKDYLRLLETYEPVE